MFSKFRETFIKKPQFTSKIPDAVLKSVGKNLPDGFRYVEDHDGFCRLECDGEMDITPSGVKLPEEAQDVFAAKGRFTIHDVFAYAYNTQRNIELTPDEDGCYTVNGQKIRCSDFVVSPMKNFELSDGRMYAMAPPFPPPFPIEVAGNGFTYTLMVQRQTINSIDKIKFASVGDGALSISYTLDSASENGSMQFNISMKPSASVADVLASKEIFNAFIQGTGTLGGVIIKSDNYDQSRRVPDEALRFWHRLSDLENVLGMKFDALQEITIDDVKMVDELYRCFVTKQPFITYQKDITISGIGELNETFLSKDGKAIGQEILFEYTEGVECNLLGIALQLYALVAVFGGIVAEITLPTENSTGEFYVKLTPAEGKRMYSAKQFYLDRTTLEKVREDKEHIGHFQTAAEIERY